MAQYTEQFLATARHGYENTDQPMRELARELGIGITTLSTLSEKYGWAKRSHRKRGLSPSMQLLVEAQALAQQAPPTYSLSSASAFLLEENGGQRPPVASPPLAALAERGETSAPAAEAPPLLDRMEQILEQLIASEEIAPANGIRSPHSARTLATLIQAMRALKGLRGPALTDTGSMDNDDDNDMPRDIDEFRRDLARRIDAFVASRTDAADAGGDAGPAPLDAAG
jgi:hypothetical protein